jgi:hypothetical protein
MRMGCSASAEEVEGLGTGAAVAEAADVVVG